MSADFRRWLYYEANIDSKQGYIQLYEAIEKVDCNEFFHCTKHDNYYSISGQSIAPIQVDESTRAALLEYLQANFLTDIPYEVDINLDQKRPASSDEKWLLMKRLLLHQKPANQSLRFAVVALILFQVFFFLEKILGVDIPIFIAYSIGLGLLLLLSYVNIKWYRDNFSPKVKYKLLFTLTMLFILFFYWFYGIENILVDVLLGEDYTILGLVVLFVTFSIQGFIIGMLLIGINYFLNGGKLVTVPGKS